MNITPSEGFIGCIIIDPDQYWKHPVKLSHLTGYWADLYSEIGFMLADGEEINEATLMLRCRDKKWWPGIIEISNLRQKIPSASLARQYARMVTDDGRKIELNLWADGIKEKLKGGIDEGLAEETASKLADIFEEQSNKPWRSLAEIAAEFRNKEQSTTEDRIYTGADVLDHNWILDKGGLHVLAGRPGMGKTSIAIWIAQQLIEKDEAVLFFSLEMTSEQVLTKLLANWSGKNKDDLKLDAALIAMLNSKSQAPLYISDAGRQTIESISIRSHIAIARRNVKLIVVDYLQKVSTIKKFQSREQEVAYIASALKALAKSIQCPILALASLNRNTEGRDGKMPQLADLRESGSIESDADSVGMLYRKEYYDKMAGKIVSEEDKGVVELSIAKQRRRGPRRMIATWIPETNTISWWENKDEKRCYENPKYITPMFGDKEIDNAIRS